MSPSRHLAPTLAALQRAACDSDTIEWEELPSMADSLRQRLVMLGEYHQRPERSSGLGPTASSAWAATLPAELDPVFVSPPFEETVHGLATREVTEPEVFRHFFG